MLKTKRHNFNMVQLPMSIEQPISLYIEKTTIYNNECSPTLCNCLIFLSIYLSCLMLQTTSVGFILLLLMATVYS
jgi:hypothetical protein